MATGTARYAPFRIINYPDDTVYPADPLDLKKFWHLTEPGSVDYFSDSLAYKLVKQMLVGQLANGARHCLTFQSFPYGENLICDTWSI